MSENDMPTFASLQNARSVCARHASHAAHAGIARTMAAKSIASNQRVDLFKSRLTMRLSDAGLRRRQTEPLYPDHRPSPWPDQNCFPRDRSSRLLDPFRTEYA